MFSLSKTGLFRKSGTALLGVALLGSLMLTACAPSAKTNDTAPNPTAAATTEAPQGITSFQSDAFDLSKQVSIDAPSAGSENRTGPEIFLASGVILKGKSDGGKTVLTYTPYESAEGAWSYEPDFNVGGVSLMRWKDKSYAVVDGSINTESEASGLSAAKKTTTENVVILDITNGKVVNTLKNTAHEVGDMSDTSRYSLSSTKEDASNKGASDPEWVSQPFRVGLVYKNASGNGKDKLVDPLTGDTIATDKTDRKGALNNETGFYIRSTTDASFNYVTKVEATFGNYALVATKQPEVRSKSGSYVQNSKYSLMNTVSNTVVSEMSCADGTHALDTVYSPDFRYVSFLGNYVFDTKTGKSFCTTPMNNLDVRQFVVSAIDNNGLMYGTADREYLRISLADNTKIETLLAGESYGTKLPLLITDKGSALFYSEQSDDVLVAIPAKEPKEG